MPGRSAPDATLDHPSGASVAQLRIELHRLQTELEDQLRLNSMLGDSTEQFVGALAHDVKNPLAAIKVNVQGLKRTLARGVSLEPEQLTERLQRIEDAVEQALGLIAAARARISASAAMYKPLEPEAMDLAELARSLVEHYHHLTGQQRVWLHWRGTVLAGVWEERRLREALQAVLDNALKFSPAPAPVTLTLQRDDARGEAVVRCRDDGIGIPERDLPHVCERFYRAENVVGRYKGAGVGLFEARAAITAHGGSLLIESVEGSGCSVTFRLPLR